MPYTSRRPGDPRLRGAARSGIITACDPDTRHTQGSLSGRRGDINLVPWDRPRPATLSRSSGYERSERSTAPMPKMKTHKGAARRFKITGTGKVMRTKGMKSHFRRRKSTRVKQQFDRMLPLDKSQLPRVKRLLPNGL